jgi:hypothetical protein
MRQNTKNRTLEGLLAVNAVLLGVIAWTQVADQPFTREATAQSRTTQNDPFRFPNAATQRADLVKAMKAVEKKIEENSKLLKAGLKVEVTNLDEIVIEMPRPASGDGGDGGG